MRDKRVKLVVKEEVRIPGTDIILEKGDIIEVIDKETLRRERLERLRNKSKRLERVRRTTKKIKKGSEDINKEKEARLKEMRRKLRLARLRREKKNFKLNSFKKENIDKLNKEFLDTFGYLYDREEINFLKTAKLKRIGNDLYVYDPNGVLDITLGDMGDGWVCLYEDYFSV